MGDVQQEGRSGHRLLHHISDPKHDLEGYLAVDGGVGQVAFGGLRVSPTVTRDTVVNLAQAMKLKYAGHGIPVRGAKAGIRCTPEHASRPEIIRAFADHVSHLLLDDVIIGKDLGASDVLLDQIYAAIGQPQLTLIRQRFDSCPPRIRDLAGYRRHMTGLGVAWAVESALQSREIEPRGARLLIQGFGRVGLGTAVHLDKIGLSLVGVSDSQGAVLCADGLPLQQLMMTVDEHGIIDRSRCRFPHEVDHRDALFRCEADVLVLAADSNSVDEPLAQQVTAHVVVEGANFGMTPGCHDILEQRGRLVVPDIIASSSSAALVGHQLATGNRLEPDALWTRIESRIRENTHSCIAESRRAGITPREMVVRMFELPDTDTIY